jgi:HEAT repeat protein
MINNQRDSAMAMLEAAVPRALAVLLEIVEDPKTSSTRLAAVQDVLDRSLGRSVQRIAPVMPDGNTPYTQDSPEATDRILARIAELARLAEERKARAEAQAAMPIIQVLTLEEAAEGPRVVERG